MGTTSPKGLRYPEPTDEARFAHLRVKDLADDINAVLVTHDNRLNALDTKTNTTNSSLSVRGDPQWRYGRSAGVITHSPNDGVNRTISHQTDQFYVHPSANYIQISMMQTSHASGAGGSAGYWETLVQFGATGWQHLPGFPPYNHNSQNNALDIGFHVVGVFDARPYRNMAGSVATNYRNDATSAGWTIHGYLVWSVVSFT